MHSTVRILALLSFFLWGCDKNMILELKDVQNFQLAEKRDVSEVQISGLAFHSALAVDNLTTREDGQDLIVEVHLVRARKGLSGSFKYTVAVRPQTRRILFGKEAK